MAYIVIAIIVMAYIVMASKQAQFGGFRSTLLASPCFELGIFMGTGMREDTRVNVCIDVCLRYVHGRTPRPVCWTCVQTCVQACQGHIYSYGL